MGLFNPGAPLHSDLNLLLQIVIFVLLTGGVLVAKLRRGFKLHGMVMAIAVTLNTFSIALVMIPSLLSFRGLLSAPFSHPALIVILHSVAGILVEILGIWLAVAWALRNRSTALCAKRKQAMRATVFIWSAELLLGIYLYIMLYAPI